MGIVKVRKRAYHLLPPRECEVKSDNSRVTRVVQPLTSSTLNLRTAVAKTDARALFQMCAENLLEHSAHTRHTSSADKHVVKRGKHRVAPCTNDCAYNANDARHLSA